MATKAQELAVKITADASDAVKAIGQVDKAAKPLEDGIDVKLKVAGGEQAAQSLKAAATAGEQLGVTLNGINAGHVRDLDGPARIAAAALGEVETAAERADKALADVDAGTGLSAVGAEAAQTKEQMQTTTAAADGTRNAFANLVGNTAQDLSGLNGALGSIGVAIGQVAEYTADATGKGGGLTSALAGAASMAGPLAALALAGAAVSKVMGDMQRSSEETKAANEALLTSFVDATGVLSDWRSELDEAFKSGTASPVEAFNKSVADMLDKTGDLDKTAVAVGKIGGSLDDMGEAMKGADAGFVDWASGWLESQGFLPQAARDIAQVVSANDKLSDALDVVNTNAQSNALSQWITPEQKARLDDYVRGLAQFNDLAEKSDIAKKAKETNDLARAQADYAAIVDQGRAAGESELQITQDVTTARMAKTTALEAEARAQEDGAAAVAAAGSIIEQVSRQEEEAAQRVADAMDDAKEAQDNWLLHEVDYQAGVDDFTESLMKLTEQTKKQKEAGDEGAGSFVGNTKAALDNRDALGDVYTKAVDVIQSMKDAGFSVDGARAAQDNMAQSAYDLAIQMGFPIEKAQEIHDKIANIQPSVTSDIIIAEQGYDEVKAKKEDLEKDTESTHFIYGVLDKSVLNAINSLPPGSIPSSRGVAPSSAGVAVTPTAGTLGAAPLPVPVAAPVQHTSSSVTVRPVVNVNVNAGVVADTFQLQRVVARAVSQGQRLNGRRP